MEFRELIDKGNQLKQSRQTNLALDTYKQALSISQDDAQEKEAWWLILHIHTDKMLAVLMEIADVYQCKVYDLVEIQDTSKKFEWVFGTNNFTQDTHEPNIKGYVKPSKESLFR